MRSGCRIDSYPGAGGLRHALLRSSNSDPPLARDVSRSSVTRSRSNFHSLPDPTVTGPKGIAMPAICTAPRAAAPSFSVVVT